jgi:beta-1,4-mannosyltransferase
MHICSSRMLCAISSSRSGICSTHHCRSCISPSHAFFFRGRQAVLFDRPPHHFHRASPPEVHEVQFSTLSPPLYANLPQLFLRLRESLPTTLYSSFFPESAPPYSTPLTHIKTPNSTTATATLAMPFPSTSSHPSTRLSTPTLRPDRPALIVSSTSWTPDEDFSILLDALGIYERRAREVNGESGSRLPKVLAILTGKGPLKDKYMNEVSRLQDQGNGRDGGWKWVRCINVWLEAEDYPLLLGVCRFNGLNDRVDLARKVRLIWACLCIRVLQAWTCR